MTDTTKEPDTTIWAFPQHPEGGWLGGEGMTLRDYFAAAAITGLTQRPTGHGNEYLAEKAYAVADALLGARDKGEKK